MAALGTFTVIIDGTRIGGTPETTARVQLKIQAQTAIKDGDANKFWFPSIPPEGVNVSLPYTLTLPTDVPSGPPGDSDTLGYEVHVHTDNGGKVGTLFAAQAAGSTWHLDDLTPTVVEPPASSNVNALRAEAAAALAEIYRDEAAAFAGTNDAIMATVAADTASQFRGLIEVNFVKNRTFALDRSSYNASLDGVNDDGSAIAAMLADAAVEAAAGGGAEVLVPDADILSTGNHVIPEGVHVIGLGKERTRLLYGGTYGRMPFDLVNADSSVIGMTIEQVGPDLYTRGNTGIGSARGLGSNALGCGVYVSAHRAAVVGLRVSNFGYGVRLDNYNIDGLGTNTVFAEDLYLEDVEIDQCHSGVIGRGHRRPYMDRVSGSYGYSDYADPPHLLYLTGQSATPSLSCQDVQIGTMRAYDGLQSDAFKLGGAKGGTVGELYARNCPGVFTIADSEDLTIGTIVSKNDLTPTGNQALTLGDSDNVRIGTAVLHMVGDGASVGRGANIGPDGNDCSIDKLVVDFSDQAAAYAGVALRFNDNQAPITSALIAEPTRIRVGELVVYGDSVSTIPLQVTGGRDCSVGAMLTRNCVYLMSVSGTYTTGFQARYDADLQLSLVNAAPLVLTGGAGTKISRVGGQVEQTITSTGNTQVYPGKAEHITLRVQTTTGLVRPVPNSAVLGLRLTLQIWNDTSGAMSAIDWTNGAGVDNFTLVSPWANPAPGERFSITFLHDGTTFREVSRSDAQPGVTINTQAGTSYTAALSDAGLRKLTTLTSGSATTYTIPPNSSVAFPIGAVLNGAAVGAGQVTITQGSGVSFIGGAYKSARTGALWAAVKIATDTWIVNGDLTA